MGGYRSGRSSGMPTVESGLTLDLGRLIKQRNVRPGAHVSGSLVWKMIRSGEKVGEIGFEARLLDHGPQWIRLHYSVNSKPMDYKVYLTSTRCNFGGVRWWWLCPLSGRRVAKLYLPPGATVFAARKAYGLPYRSQRESGIDTTHARQARLSRKLGANYDYFERYVPERPKGMHKRTYYRLAANLEGAIEAHEEVFSVWATRTLRKFGRLP
jgi:hypothetical protein